MGLQELTCSLSPDIIMINSVCFSPIGMRLLLPQDDNTAKLWDLQGNLLGNIHGHHYWINSVVLATTGNALATASIDGYP